MLGHLIGLPASGSQLHIRRKQAQRDHHSGTQQQLHIQCKQAQRGHHIGAQQPMGRFKLTFLNYSIAIKKVHNWSPWNPLHKEGGTCPHSNLWFLKKIFPFMSSLEYYASSTLFQHRHLGLIFSYVLPSTTTSCPPMLGSMVTGKGWSWLGYIETMQGVTKCMFSVGLGFYRV